MADEHMSFLNAGHGRRWDTDGHIGEVCQCALLPEEGYRSRPELPGRTYRLNHVRGAATRTEADDKIIAPDDRFYLATKGRRVAHIIADSREQGGILGQHERQQPLMRPWMRSDTLHFSGDMLGIAGTSSIPTQHHLPLAAQRCHQLAGDLHDETRHSGQLLDNGAMLVQRFGDLHLHVHLLNPFFYNA